MNDSSSDSGSLEGRIKKLRLQSGPSQEAFADKYGLDRAHINGIECGLRSSTLEVINVLAKGPEEGSLFHFDIDRKK